MPHPIASGILSLCAAAISVVRRLRLIVSSITPFQASNCSVSNSCGRIEALIRPRDRRIQRGYESCSDAVMFEMDEIVEIMCPGAKDGFVHVAEM